MGETCLTLKRSKRSKMNMGVGYWLNANTVKSCYLELDRTGFKLQDIRVFEISKVKYPKYKWLGLTNYFDISIVFQISEFEIPKINCI